MARHLKLLIVEDSAIDAELMVRELRRCDFNPQWTRVETEATFLAALEAEPEIIISDYSMPNFDGISAYRKLRETERDIPFILVSGRVGEDIAVEAMHWGVTDYLLKDRLARLGAAVEQAIETVQLQKQKRLAEQQRLQAENELRQTESRLRLVTDRARVGLVVLNQERHYVFANTGYVDILDLPSGEILGRNVSEILPAAYETQIGPRLDQAYAGNRVEYELHLPGNEHERYFEVHYEPVFNGQQVVNVVVVVMDISRQKRSEMMLRIQDRAIQSASQGILIVDALQTDLPIIYVNQAFESITGYSAAEVLGRNCRFLQGDATNPTAVAAIRDALSETRPLSIELLNYRKDGTPFWNQTSISPVRDESGKVTHFIGVQHDVTETRNIEEQLRQTKKMNAIGRLAGGLAHDFNNVLSAIDSFTNILLDDVVDSEPSHALLKKIQSASDFGMNLTQQLLAFSRRQPHSPESLDVNVIVRETIQMIERLLGNDVELILVLEPDLQRISADRSQLSQVLINLAINARDAMSGSGRLSIRTRNVTVSEPRVSPTCRVEPGKYALLEVADTGCGMTAELQSQIFEPLFTTKPIGHGTGLGLSTVYGIITQSGSCIEVDSVVGTGTKFSIYLPVA